MLMKSLLLTYGGKVRLEIGRTAKSFRYSLFCPEILYIFRDVNVRTAKETVITGMRKVSVRILQDYWRLLRIT